MFQFLKKTEIIRIKGKKIYKRSAAYRKEYRQAWILYGGLRDAVRREFSYSS